MYQLCDASQNLDNQYYHMDLLMDSASLSKETNFSSIENLTKLNSQHNNNNNREINHHNMTISTNDDLKIHDQSLFSEQTSTDLQHNIASANSEFNTFKILNANMHNISSQNLAKNIGKK